VGGKACRDDRGERPHFCCRRRGPERAFLNATVGGKSGLPTQGENKRKVSARNYLREKIHRQRKKTASLSGGQKSQLLATHEGRSLNAKPEEVSPSEEERRGCLFFINISRNKET